jgi:hypothetical protein
MALNANQASVRSAKEQADNGRTTYALKVLKDALKLQEQLEPLKNTLGWQGQAIGLSAQEVANARTLLDQLRAGTF